MASVWRFDVPAASCGPELVVSIDGVKRSLHQPPVQHGGIACTTLFKGNYDLFVHHALYHRREHGVGDFLYYYNGHVPELEGFLSRSRADERLRAAGVRVYLFELDAPYWQRFESRQPKRCCASKGYHHIAQALQNAHAAILAHHCFDFLGALDLDEFLEPASSADELRQSLELADVTTVAWKHMRCAGRLCSRDPEEYDEKDIVGAIAPSPHSLDGRLGKFFEKTKGRAILARDVYCSAAPLMGQQSVTQTAPLRLLHVRCLSHSWGDRAIGRLCS